DGARTQLAMKPLVRPQLTRDLELEVTTGPDQGRRFGPLPLPIRIGSAEGNEVRLTDPTVSRFHLGIESSALGPRAVDAGSTNGT
ncbi:FHA domain-containing protein, partial [Loigolactobacillus coryniformis]|uniref:FHA domain-containing protein n=1 Tax=Loigolactobacillus coryniformis TaxID=1610 RepID=UPI00201B074D